MKRVVSLIVMVLVLLTGTGCQQRGPELEATTYQPNKDMYIVFHGLLIKRVTSLLPVSLLGEIAFKLQEGTHSSVRDVSQAEIDHYYIWVCLADDCIPIDPFSYSY
jgi:hypothetical protein